MVTIALIGNLFTANNILSFWEAAEVMNMLTVQSEANTFFLPALILKGIYAFAGLDAFAMRLPGVLFFLGAISTFYYVGKKLFGKETLLTFLLVICSALILVNMSKFAFGDVYLLGLQLLNMIFLLRLLKTPASQWEIGFWLTTLLGLFVHPVSMLVWSGGWWLWLYLRHPQGKSLPKSGIWAGVAILAGAIISLGWVDWQSPSFLFSFKSSSLGFYLTLLLLGCLPWLGFLPSGLRDLRMKRKKGEELSLFITGWLLIGLLSYSSIAVVGLLFLMAKQVQLSLDPKYPHRNTLQISISLVLVLSFAGVFLLLMGSYNLFDAAGFRAAVLAGGCYWALYFLGSMGVLMKKELVMIGGFTFSGILLTAFFWARFGPLIEAKRDLPVRLIEEARQKIEDPDTKPDLWLGNEKLLNSPKFRLYATESFNTIQIVPKDRLFKLPPSDIILLDSTAIGTLDTSWLSAHPPVQGFSSIFGTLEEYHILRSSSMTKAKQKDREVPLK